VIFCHEIPVLEKLENIPKLEKNFFFKILLIFIIYTKGHLKAQRNYKISNIAKNRL